MIEINKKLFFGLLILFFNLLLTINAVGCNRFSYSNKNVVFAGGNTDTGNYPDPTTATIYFFPKTKKTHGVILFGYPDTFGCYSSGVNDKGFYYTTVAVPYLPAHNQTTLYISPKYLL